MEQIWDVPSRIIVPGTKTKPNGVSTNDGRKKLEQAYSYIREYFLCRDWADSKWHPIHKVKEMLHNNNLTFLNVNKPYIFSFFPSVFSLITEKVQGINKQSIY